MEVHMKNIKKIYSIFFSVTILISLFLLFGCGGDGSSVNPPHTATKELFVLNSGGSSVSVFDASSGGDILPLRTFGNVTGLSSPKGIAVDPIHDEIFVVNSLNYTITVYVRTANGNLAPLRVISGPTTGMIEPVSIAVDTVNNEIFVGNYGGLITVYPRTASGSVPPLRRIEGDATGLQGGRIRVAVDAVHNELFALNDGATAMSVFARTADGNAAPLRTINLLPSRSLQLNLAVDAVNNEIIVGNSNSVMVYARTASGDAAPLRTISGDATGINWPNSVAVDTRNDEILVANNHANTVTVYARAATGNVAPLRTISGDFTGLSGPLSVAVDMLNNGIFTGNDSNSVTVYARAANGNVAPSRTVGVSQRLSELKGIAADTVHNEVFFASSGSNSIFVYAKTADGNAAPLRTISGPATGLNRPTGVSVDALNNEIFVPTANEDGTNSIRVYARTADGNTTPLRTITGPDTGLGVPINPGGFGTFVTTRGIAVDTVNNEIFVIVVYQSSVSPGAHSEKIAVYPRTADGNVAPLRMISPGFTSVLCMAVDTVNNEIFVGGGLNSIAVFARTADGSATPLRTISGDAIFGPKGIAVDTASNEIFVSNDIHFFSADYAIIVYDRTASGNAAPLRTITGRPAGLNFPDGMALATQ